MLDKLDKKQKIMIVVTVIAVLFVMSFISIIISISGSKKDKNKIDEVNLKATVIDENTLNLEIDAPKNKMINYILEKSDTLDFENKEEVKGSTNTEKVQIDTKDIESITYYRVKMQNTETKEVTYSNVISLSPKEEQNEEKQKENNNENDIEELEIGERKEEKSTKKDEEESESNSEQSKENSEEISSETENTQSEKVNKSSSNSKQSSSKSSSKKSSKSKSSNKKSSYIKSSSYYEEDDYENYEEYDNYEYDQDEEEENNDVSKISKKSNSTKEKNSSSSIKTNIEIKNEEKIIEVKSIKLSTSNVELDMSVKTNKQINITIEPENATDKNVEWISENEKIVTVDKTGKITAVSNGQTNIIAKVGKKQAKCKVKVITTATGIKIDKTNINIDLSESKQKEIIAEVEPQTATNKKITWTSENTKIARVDSNGFVTGVSNGKTKIIAKIGTITKECSVTVETSPQSIKLNKKTIELDINQNNQEKIKAKITPTTSSYTKVKWKTSNKKVE